MNGSRVVLAGATGQLGVRIARQLVGQGGTVTALVRRDSRAAEIQRLRETGVAVAEVDYGRAAELQGLCAGASCVVSARVAGDQVTASEIAAIASDLSGERYRVLRPGGIALLDVVIRLARAFDRKEEEVFPPWQGMQYMRDMYAGQAKLEALDNRRYPELSWTSVREVMAADPRLQRSAGLPSTG
jgi:putative NADH-flavin reductase